MVYDKKLANRIQKILQNCKGVTEKEMFGGIAFMMKGRMCCGVIKDNLVARVDPNDYEKLLEGKNVLPMDFSGRPMKGFIYVSSMGCKSNKTLAKWVSLGVDYVNSIKDKKNLEVYKNTLRLESLTFCTGQLALNQTLRSTGF